jgi:hypothetical protein
MQDGVITSCVRRRAVVCCSLGFSAPFVKVLYVHRGALSPAIVPSIPVLGVVRSHSSAKTRICYSCVVSCPDLMYEPGDLISGQTADAVVDCPVHRRLFQTPSEEEIIGDEQHR